MKSHKNRHKHTEKSIKIDGELPQGVLCEYKSNTATDAGVYKATATLTGDGYNTLILSANLTIEKADYDMSGVEWIYEEGMIYNGEEKTVTLSTLPEGVTVKKYTDNKKTNAGSYVAKAEFSYDEENYNEPSISILEWKIDKADYDMSKISWRYEGKNIYNASPISILISEGIPEGVYVEKYEGNEYTEVGKYTATASFSYDEENFNPPASVSFDWEILKATMRGIDLSNTNATYESLSFEHKVTLIGYIPQGSTVRYYYDGKEVDSVSYGGEITVEAVIENPNYNTYTVTDTLTINITAPKFSENICEIITARYPTSELWQMHAKIREIGLNEFIKLYPPEYILVPSECGYIRVAKTKTNFQGEYLAYSKNADNPCLFKLFYISEDEKSIAEVEIYQSPQSADSPYTTYCSLYGINDLTLEDIDFLKIKETTLSQFETFCEENNLNVYLLGINFPFAQFITSDGYMVSIVFSHITPKNHVLTEYYLTPYFDN